MNQILSVDNNEYRKRNKTSKTSQPIEIKKVSKFFAIAIIIFGVFLTGTGSYSIYKEVQNSIAVAKPTIFVQTTSEEEITLKITHDKNLAKVSYSWNEDEEIDIPCSGKKNIEQVIEIPTGTNVLKVYASDINGQEIRYPQTFTRVGDINIEIAVEGNSLKITAEGKNELSYMTYRWDEEEETTINVNDNKLEEKIEAKKGNHNLTVVVVDVNNNTETKTKEVKGVTKPTLKVVSDGESFIINATDEEGLDKIEFVIYEGETQRKEVDLEGKKEIEYSYKLHEGLNKVEINVYNNSNVKETKRVKFEK